MEQEPTYHLEGVIRSREELEDFEGPLTLILMLLSKNKIEIRDIPVAEILEQYLAYLDEMKAMDLEIASEFVQMASYLLYIKTKMLLNTEEEASELELLIASLEQLKSRDVYASVKEICPALESAARQGMLYTVKPPEPLPQAKEYRYRHESWELLKAMRDVLLRGHGPAEETEEAPERRRRIYPRRIIYNVRDKSREILLRLRAAGRLSLTDFYRESRSRSEVVATFISILELCSLGRTSLQRENDQIMVSFSGGNIEEIIGQIGE
jgi:segregation and condensation protein A